MVATGVRGKCGRDHEHLRAVDGETPIQLREP
jgi:hypothetical protein